MQHLTIQNMYQAKKKDKAVDWIVKNFVKKSKNERATAIESFPIIAKDKAYRNYAENIAEDILNAGKNDEVLCLR